MGMGSGGGIRAAVAEINVTPLIDVLLVLLIIFMVILPQAPNGLKAVVPQPPKNQLVEPAPETTIVVQVLSGKSGEPSYKINEEPFAKSRVEAKLAEIFALRQEKTMFVKGDPELRYETIAEVIDYAHLAGVENVGIITPAVAAGR